eukprot:1778707-Lingulodinium_polyedra.AAC.1
MWRYNTLCVTIVHIVIRTPNNNSIKRMLLCWLANVLPLALVAIHAPDLRIELADASPELLGVRIGA